MRTPSRSNTTFAISEICATMRSVEPVRAVASTSRWPRRSIAGPASASPTDGAAVAVAGHATARATRRVPSTRAASTLATTLRMPRARKVSTTFERNSLRAGIGERSRLARARASGTGALLELLGLEERLGPHPGPVGLVLALPAVLRCVGPQRAGPVVAIERELGRRAGLLALRCLRHVGLGLAVVFG